MPDPRGKTWAPYLQGHLKWWDAIYAAAGARGAATMTTTPEFGPPPYCWVDPYTNAPLVDVFDVNHWVGGQVSALFAARFGAAAAGKLAPLNVDTGADKQQLEK